jgi:nucleotide-binding universal stress UspA family protein/hemerythrin-like domain-containing protein
MIYQHFLVPIDDTAISAANLRTAIQMAGALGARITFFHALLDWSATSDGAILRSLDLESNADLALGSSNVVLSKAVSAARVLGVAAEACARVCNRPAEAIIDAAQRLGCDLIVMASRGPRGGLPGWMYSSQTERVLRRSPVALLVTRVDSNAPLTAEERAIGIIEDEHRSIAVVVEGLRDIVRNTPQPPGAAVLQELEYVITYLGDFPACVHHPKEEQYLHRLLRQRDADAELLLREVEAQHRGEHESIERALAAFAGLKQNPQGGMPAFAAAAEALASHVLQHIGLEEREVLPLARQRLAADDWEEIAATFAENGGPNYGDLSVAEFRRLFSHIANTLSEGGIRALK